ncbi:response regulator [Roseiconus nitratireducens]|uniref:Response regulator n=1 Tax=Roseiconus nitratireducens TaxID=2605748 RepID=A0A5M6DDT7_9BACT|nr:response regulator [Roseiconus nitratireducens]
MPLANSSADCRLPAGTRSHRSGPTILVADDSRAVLRVTERVLVSAGYQVVSAEDGREAVRRALVTKPRLIVLDINMPELNGYAVCHHLLTQRRWDPRTPVIFLTSSDGPHLASLGDRFGAYLSKPADPRLLLQTVRTLLDPQTRKHTNQPCFLSG